MVLYFGGHKGVLKMSTQSNIYFDKELRKRINEEREQLFKKTGEKRSFSEMVRILCRKRLGMVRE